MFSLSGQVVVVSAKALLVDTTGAGNLNGVLEIGETATIAPSWTNNVADDYALAGTATLTGPAGPTYTLDDSIADLWSDRAGRLGQLRDGDRRLLRPDHHGNASGSAF